ncbi:MAG: hypothetical protein WD771_00985 [Gemmatimonadaceae bacterium]
MSRPRRTNPFDIVLGLRLLEPAGTLGSLAEELGVVPSQIHAALGRLAAAALLKPESRATNARALGEFLLFGVRYAFPAARGELALGVPTAYSALPLSATVDAVDVLVWPAARAPDPVRGFSITPLYSGAPGLRESSPPTYRLLTLVDALRIGDPRVRNTAREALEIALEIALGWRAAAAS